MEKEISIIRYRGLKKLDKVKELDIFPKLEEKFKETSALGGTLSLISFGIIFWLIYSEINYYINSKFVIKFSPDTELNEKLKINVDLTVAMPCSNLGADILDSTSQNTFKFGSLEEEDTWFELDRNQRQHFDNKRNFNFYVREEYHAIHEFLWRSSRSYLQTDEPKRKKTPDTPHDACRIYGSLVLNKVAGNFHITAGRSLSLPQGHIHISMFMSDGDYNFTHRINKLSFGDATPGIIHPLEGEEYITEIGPVVFNYFIEVVPTTVNTFLFTTNTYQYSVKQLNRPIDHNKGSHGMPGIFFKYDMSALRVTVKQERDYFGTFIARLCSVIAGIYILSGFFKTITHFITSLLLCRWGSKGYKVCESNGVGATQTL